MQNRFWNWSIGDIQSCLPGRLPYDSLPRLLNRPHGTLLLLPRQRRPNALNHERHSLPIPRVHTSLREDAKLRTAQRLTNLIAIFCLISWRIFWLTMANRTTPAEPPRCALTKLEINLLDHIVKDREPCSQKTLSHYLTKIARLGGYLARASDPPPGNSVMWRGMTRLADITLGAVSMANIVGIGSFTGWVPIFLSHA
jgi:hypothetical protein